MNSFDVTHTWNYRKTDKMDRWDKILFSCAGFQYSAPANSMQFLDKQAQSSSVSRPPQRVHFQLFGSSYTHIWCLRKCCETLTSNTCTDVAIWNIRILITYLNAWIKEINAGVLHNYSEIGPAAFISWSYRLDLVYKWCLRKINISVMRTEIKLSKYERAQHEISACQVIYMKTQLEFSNLFNSSYICVLSWHSNKL